MNMEMKRIREFFERYKTALLKNSAAREDVILLIYKVTGITLQQKEFKYERGRITLSTTSIKKNHIFLYKKELLRRMQELGMNDILDIH
jgi:hypothetical protein